MLSNMNIKKLIFDRDTSLGWRLTERLCVSLETWDFFFLGKLNFEPLNSHIFQINQTLKKTFQFKSYTQLIKLTSLVKNV